MAKAAGSDVKTLKYEFNSNVAPPRMFKASLDGHNLLPKICPQNIKSIELSEGNGGAGTVKKTTFADGRCMKHRVDSIDEKNHELKYTVFEGDVLGKNLASICYEVKFEPSGSGSVCKTISHCKLTQAGADIKEDEINAGRERAMEMHKVLENHLVQNPSLYA